MPAISERVRAAAAVLGPRQKKFGDLYLAGEPAGRAYEKAGYKAKGDAADVAAAQALRFTKVGAYIAAVQDEGVAASVLDSKVVHGYAMRMARGSESIPAGQQLEAIRYLDAVLERARRFIVDGANIPPMREDFSEKDVARIGLWALECQAAGLVSHADATSVIGNCATVQQIMHGMTLGAEMRGQPIPPKMVGSGDGGELELTVPAPAPVRPKWLKTAAAKADAADATKNGNGAAE